MLRIAYLDEFPWVRCNCGWVVSESTGSCPGCGTEGEPDRRDRFGVVGGPPSTDVRGNEYRPVPYEDENRRLFV